MKLPAVTGALKPSTIKLMLPTSDDVGTALLLLLLLLPVLLVSLVATAADAAAAAATAAAGDVFAAVLLLLTGVLLLLLVSGVGADLRIVRSTVARPSSRGIESYCSSVVTCNNSSISTSHYSVLVHASCLT
jgi:hypothetical protein